MARSYFSAQGLIYTALCGVALLGVALTVSMVFWMADVTNDYAAEESLQVAHYAVDEVLPQIEEAAQFNAHWSAIHAAVTDDLPEAEREAELWDLFGSAVALESLFDTGTIVTASGEVLRHYQSPENDDVELPRDIGDRLNRALARAGDDPLATVSDVVMAEGRIYVVAAAYIQPKDETIEEDAEPTHGLPIEDLPILHVGWWLESPYGFLTEAREDWGLNDAVLRPPGQAPGPGQMAVPVRDRAGMHLADLVWSPDRPGDVPLAQVLPLVAGLSALFVLLSFFAARSSVRQLGALNRERLHARTDALTGLMNRIAMQERVAEPDVAEAIATGRAAVLFLDLDGFKEINDSAGHDAGDLALQVTADRIASSLRQDDLLARMGGDEFVAVLQDSAPEAAACRVGQAILDATLPPLHLASGAFVLQPSIGIAVADAQADWPQLVQRADKAMYHAKMSETRGLCVYRNGMTGQQRRRSDLKVVSSGSAAG